MKINPPGLVTAPVGINDNLQPLSHAETSAPIWVADLATHGGKRYLAAIRITEGQGCWIGAATTTRKLRQIPLIGVRPNAGNHACCGNHADRSIYGWCPTADHSSGELQRIRHARE